MNIAELKEYFEDTIEAQIDLSNFDFDTFCVFHNLSKSTAEVMLFNLANKDIIQEICNGVYSNFDCNDNTIFNDCYTDMLASIIESKKKYNKDIKVAIMDYNSCIIFIVKIAAEDIHLIEDETNDIAEDKLFDYVNETYNKEFSMSECHWMFGESINVELEV